MKNKLLYRLTLSGLLAAVICVMTLIAVPLPANGYANLGDCFVIVSGVLLGPVYGPCAAAIGSMLADLFLGYAVYAPATFVIKGLMALAVGLITTHLSTVKSWKAVLLIILSAIVSELVMVLGYFLFETILYGYGVALADTLGNSVQGAVGAVAATFICSVMSSAGLISKIKNGSKE